MTSPAGAPKPFRRRRAGSDEIEAAGDAFASAMAGHAPPPRDLPRPSPSQLRGVARLVLERWRSAGRAGTPTAGEVSLMLCAAGVAAEVAGAEPGTPPVALADAVAAVSVAISRECAELAAAGR